MKTKFFLFVVFFVITRMAVAQNDTITGVLLDVNDKAIKNYPITLGSVSPVTVKTDKYGIFTFPKANLHDTLYVGDKKGKNIVKIPVNGYPFVAVKSLKGNFNTEYLSKADERLVRSVEQEIKQNTRSRSSTTLTREEIQQSGCRDVYCLVRRFSGVTAGPSGIKISGSGTSSLASNTSALIVIDGVPDGNINSVPIDDIETISVLKDASIYGVRGANGAILINTRK